MEKYEHIHRGVKKIFVHNFIGGIAWGLGATIGLSIILAILGFIFGQADWIPLVGDFIASINEYLQNNPRLSR